MSHTIIPTALPEVLLLKPKVFSDDRGFFYESFNIRDFKKATELDVNFVQDNYSRSMRGVLRGLHYQIQHPQGKLVQVMQGAVFDVVVDIRNSSNNFGKWIGVELSSENKHQLWIPPGFAHGFLVTSEIAEFFYKTTDYWYPQFERTLLWSDPNIDIKWPIKNPPLLTPKDAAGTLLSAAEIF